MQKKSITDMLAEIKALEQKEKELKAAMKEKKRIAAVEYADNLPAEEKAKQIAEAEAILSTAAKDADKAKATFREAMIAIKARVAFAKEILAFVSWKQSASLPKIKNAFWIEGKALKFSREGLKEITIDVSSANWPEIFKAELAKQGINGADRVADNIVYKAKTMLAGNIAIK